MLYMTFGNTPGARVVMTTTKGSTLHMALLYTDRYYHTDFKSPSFRAVVTCISGPSINANY